MGLIFLTKNENNKQDTVASININANFTIGIKTKFFSNNDTATSIGA